MNVTPFLYKIFATLKRLMKSLVKRDHVGLKELRYRIQRATFEGAKENEEFNITQRIDQQDDGPDNTQRNKKYPKRNADTLATYTIHTNGQCVTRFSGGCSGGNHFKWVCWSQIGKMLAERSTEQFPEYARTLRK